MKKYIVLLCILAALLTACKPVSGPENELSGDSSQSAGQPDAADDSQPSADTLTKEELLIAQFDALFGNPGSWHQIALYSEYISVDKLEVRDLFWDGYPGEAPLTDAEYNQVLLHERDADIADIRRLNIAKVDKVLNSVFGVSFAQMKEYHAVSDIYGLTSESGYMLRGEPRYIENYKTVAVEEQEDGSLAVTYTTGAENTAYIATVVPDEQGSYHVISNLAVIPKPGTYGAPFVHDGTNPMQQGDVDLSECVLGSFYYLDWNTEEAFFICDDPLVGYTSNDDYVFFVKAEEPTKIYSAPIADATQHTMVYESDLGPIGQWFHTGPQQFSSYILQFVEGNTRFVLLDLKTGESSVLMEQYYISDASIYAKIAVDGEHEHQDAESRKGYYQIYFYGKLSEDSRMREYLYNMETGTVTDISTED